MSQEDLARALDTNWRQVHRFESGETPVTCGRLYELSQALDVSLNWFFLRAPVLGSTLGSEGDSNDDPIFREVVGRLREISDPWLLQQVLNVIHLLVQIDQKKTDEPARQQLLSDGC